MNRALVIASVLSILILAALAADVVQYLFAVPLLPEEMKCAVRRNCLAITSGQLYKGLVERFRAMMPLVEFVNELLVRVKPARDLLEVHF